MKTSASARAIPVLFALGGIWGSSFLFIKVLVDEVSPLEVAAGRIFFGLVAVMAFVIARRTPLRVTRVLLGHIIVLTVLGNITPFTLIAVGQQYIPSGTAAVLNSTMPIFTAVFAALILTEERFTAGRVGGLLLGFVGVAVLTGNGALNVTDSGVLGQLAIVGAAASYGLAAVYARNLLRDVDPLGLSALQLLTGVALTAPVVLLAYGTSGYASLSVEAVLSLLALGMLGTGVGYIAYLWLIEVIGSVRSSLVTYIIPAVGLFLGWIVLGESIGVNTIAGSLLIVGGVAVVMRGQGLAPQRREPRPVPAAPEAPAATVVLAEPISKPEDISGTVDN